MSGERWADEVVATTRVALDRRKVGTRVQVTRDAVLHADTHRIADELAGRLTLQLESYVLTERLVGEQHTVAGHLPFPASPWQHFKERHAGAWWLRRLVARRPVRYASHAYSHDVRFERYAMFPTSTLQVPALGGPVVFEQVHDRRVFP